jgi:hypothetical protein
VFSTYDLGKAVDQTSIRLTRATAAANRPVYQSGLLPHTDPLKGRSDLADLTCIAFLLHRLQAVVWVFIFSFNE